MLLRPMGQSHNCSEAMNVTESAELYHDQMIGMLERVWGDGWLSPGGPAEVARLLEGIDLKGKSVLDIGCGAGGIDVLLVGTHGAGYVTGIDVEDTVLAHARERAEKTGHAAQIGLVKVVPGPLPFPSQTFDIVFSKDLIVHIPDKQALMRDVFRVLKPGGWFVASDWLIGHDHEPSPGDESLYCIGRAGFRHGFAPALWPMRWCRLVLRRLKTRSSNAWYRWTGRVKNWP